MKAHEPDAPIVDPGCRAALADDPRLRDSQGNRTRATKAVAATGGAMSEGRGGNPEGELPLWSRRRRDGEVAAASRRCVCSEPRRVC